MLTIYGRANSINVRKVLWIAEEIGLKWTREDWGRGFRATSEPEFQRVSAFGVVPVIEDDGFILRESNTIVRYLAAKHARTDLYPTDLKARAIAEQWMDWAATDCYSALRPVFLGLVAKLAPWKDDAAALAASTRDWAGHMQRLDRHLAAHGPYVGGPSFTIGDIPVGLIVNRWLMSPIERPAAPAVAAYYERLSQRPAYRAHGRNGTP